MQVEHKVQMVISLDSGVVKKCERSFCGVVAVALRINLGFLRSLSEWSRLAGCQDRVRSRWLL